MGVPTRLVETRRWTHATGSTRLPQDQKIRETWSNLAEQPEERSLRTRFSISAGTKGSATQLAIPAYSGLGRRFRFPITPALVCSLLAIVPTAFRTQSRMCTQVEIR